MTSFGVVGWAAAGVAFIAPLVTWLFVSLLPVPTRDPRDDPGEGVAEMFVNGVLAPGLWEETVWRLAVLGIVGRVAGPRRAVALTAVSTAVAHTSLSMGFGQVHHDVPASTSLGTAVQVAIAGLFLGFLVVELGSVWPAVAVHAASNVLPQFREAAPWLAATGLLVVIPPAFIAIRV